ncbi:hypothetical protein [Rhodococcus sp. IEGM 1318]|nr:hypothetical protein [Rhodococcus sp. IEGM 1318]MDV8009627.1 hypothetical protein [Rhodococcus sp. IEGM 1318]
MTTIVTIRLGKFDVEANDVIALASVAAAFAGVIGALGGALGGEYW